MGRKKTPEQKKVDAKAKPGTEPYRLNKLGITAESVPYIYDYNYAPPQLINSLIEEHGSFGILVYAFSGAFIFDWWRALTIESVYFVIDPSNKETYFLIRERIFYRPDQPVSQFRESAPYPEGEPFLERRYRLNHNEGPMVEALKWYNAPTEGEEAVKYYSTSMEILNLLCDPKINQRFKEKKAEIFDAVDRYVADYPNHEKINMSILSRYLYATQPFATVAGNIAHNRILRMPWIRNVCEERFAASRKKCKKI